MNKEMRMSQRQFSRFQTDKKHRGISPNHLSLTLQVRGFLMHVLLTSHTGPPNLSSISGIIWPQRLQPLQLLFCPNKSARRQQL